LFNSGDIVKFYSKVAGKPKFHLCLCVGKQDGIYKFLMINSKAGYKSDIVFKDGDIPGLPASKTGVSVVSLSTICRVKVEKMHLWQPSFVDKMPKNILLHIKGEVPNMASLTKSEKELLFQLIDGLI